MPAKLDTLTPIEYAKPARPPLDLRGSLAEAIKSLDKVIAKEQDVDRLLELRVTLYYVEHAARLCSKRLPGFEDMETKSPRPRFIPPTLAEVRVFCSRRDVDIPTRDADWFWLKMDGTGWKNGGKAVVSWQSTLRAWKLANYLPSQKMTNAAGQIVPKVRTVLEKDLDSLNRNAGNL